MKKIFSITSICLFAFLCTSCKDAKVKSYVNDFFSCLEKENEDRLLEMYPNMESFIHHKSSAKHKISSVELEDSIYVVKVTNQEDLNINKETDVTLYISTVNDNYEIVNSKGLADFENDDFGGIFFSFCKGIGAIQRGNKDVENMEAVDYSRRILKIMLEEAKKDLMSNIKVTSWNWRKEDYVEYVSGNGIIVNNSRYNALGLKVTANFYDANGTLLVFETKQMGDMNSGYQGAFKFDYIGYTKKPTRSDVTFSVDEDRICEAILNNQWTGSEYDKYITKAIFQSAIQHTNEVLGIE